MNYCWSILDNDLLREEYSIHEDLFDGLGNKSLRGIVNSIYEYIIENGILCNKGATIEIANSIFEFHNNANTLTKGVLNKIEEIRNGENIILIAHQPNIFPSISIVVPIIMLNLIYKTLFIEKKVRVVPIFLFVDYDKANDKRFLGTKIPDISKKDGEISLKNTLIDSEKNYLMYEIRKPNETRLNKWIATIKTSIENMAELIKKNSKADFKITNYLDFVDENLKVVTDLISECYDMSKSFAEFNEFFLSKLVNILWNYDILFIQGHSLYLNENENLNMLIKDNIRINACVNEALNILSENEVSTTIKKKENDEVGAWCYNKNCHNRCRINEDKKGTFELTGKGTKGICKYDYLYPDVIYDNLLDHLHFNKVGSTGYYKAAEHVVISNYVCRKLYKPVSPQLLFCAKGKHMGLLDICDNLVWKRNIDIFNIHKAVLLSETNQCSIVYFLIAVGIHKFESIWAEYLFETDDVNIPIEGGNSNETINTNYK